MGAISPTPPAPPQRALPPGMPLAVMMSAMAAASRKAPEALSDGREHVRKRVGMLELNGSNSLLRGISHKNICS